MKLTFNIDEEINRIKTGDTVLISGLYGKNFQFINNKCGKIVNVFMRNDGDQIHHIADVMVDGSAEIVYQINFDFIYKLDFCTKIVDNISQHLFTMDNVYIYYIHKKHITHSMHFQDEIGQCMTIGVDKGGKSHVLLFSGIN